MTKTEDKSAIAAVKDILLSNPDRLLSDPRGDAGGARGGQA